MHVLVTGATGFVGSHATEALLDAGHRVTALVRDPGRLDGALTPSHRARVETATGDMLVRDSVERALVGVDAVLHAAGVVGVSKTGAGSRDANLEGTTNVVGAAVAAGCDPVVYTSSVAAMLPTSSPLLTVDSPLGDPPGAYSRSKVDAEVFVRALQAADQPVTTFYVGGVAGPRQPDVASSMEGIVAAASQLMVVPDGGIGTIDVRDLAGLLVASMVPGQGPRRFMAGGQFLTWAEWTDLLSRVIGRPVRRVRMPNPLLKAMGWSLDAAKRVRYFDYPLTYEAAIQMTSSPRTDDRPTLEALGCSYRPVAETLEESARWLVEAGHLDVRHTPAFAG